MGVGKKYNLPKYTPLSGLTIQQWEDKILLNNENLFKMFLQIPYIGHWIANLTTNTLIWSHSMYRICGISNKDFKPTFKSALNFIHPDDFRLFKSLIKNLSVEKNYSTEIFRIIWRDNSIHYAECTFFLYNDLKNQAAILIGSVLDITKSRLAENKIRVSEDRLHDLYNNCPIGLYRTTPDGKIVLANPALVKMLGYETFEELSKRDLENYGYVNPTKRKKYLDILEKNGYINNFESEWYRKDGSIVFIRESSKAISDEKGNIIYYDGNVEDITERKNAENEIKKYKNHLEEIVRARTNELEQSRETFKAITENTKDSIIKFDSQLRCIYINSAVKELTNLTIEQCKGKTYDELGFPRDFSEKLKSSLKTVLETKRKQRVEISLPNGLCFDYFIVPEYDLNGNVSTVCTSGRDITEYKKLLLTLKNNFEKEQELNELKNRFISIVSHEFRTPLASILSSAQLLKRYQNKWKEEKIDEHHERIKCSIKKLTELLDDILTISKNEYKIDNNTNDKLNLFEDLSKLIAELKPLLTKNHKIEFKYKSDRQFFRLDKKTLHLIFTNLLINAVKYSPKGGKIKLEVSEKNNNIVFEVSDEGIGIDKKELQYIFDPFFRAKKTEHIGGSGLGLALVRQAVWQYNGTIEASSKNGKGTLIKIKIPLKRI